MKLLRRRPDSVEKQSKRALRRIVFWRLVGEVFTLPQIFLRVVEGLMRGLGGWFRHLKD